MKSNSSTIDYNIPVILPTYLKSSFELVSYLSAHLTCQLIDMPLVQSIPTQSPKQYGQQWIDQHLAPHAQAIALWSGIACGRRLLPVATDIETMTQILARLEGRQHQLITVTGLKRADRFRMRTTVTRLKFKRLSLSERQTWLAQPQYWRGYLGGYVGNLWALRYVTAINGDPTAPYGIAYHRLYQMLQGNEFLSS